MSWRMLVRSCQRSFQQCQSHRKGTGCNALVLEKSWIGPDRRPRPRPRVASAARPCAGDQFIVMVMSKPMVCQVMFRPATRPGSIGLYYILLIISPLHSPGCTGPGHMPARPLLHDIVHHQKGLTAVEVSTACAPGCSCSCS